MHYYNRYNYTPSKRTTTRFSSHGWRTGVWSNRVVYTELVSWEYGATALIGSDIGIPMIWK